MRVSRAVDTHCTRTPSDALGDGLGDLVGRRLQVGQARGQRVGEVHSSLHCRCFPQLVDLGVGRVGDVLHS